MSSAAATDEGVVEGVTREDVEAQRRCVTRMAGRTRRFIMCGCMSLESGKGGGSEAFARGLKKGNEERHGGQFVFERAECAPKT